MHRFPHVVVTALALALAPACSFDTVGLGTEGGSESSSTSLDPTSTSTTGPGTSETVGTGMTGSTTSTTAPTTTDSTTTASTTTDSSTTVAPPACGDGVLDAGEECDDGAMNGPGQACKADCTLNVCGDGDQGPGEGCDDGNTADGDMCSATCALESCGNGKVDPGEECDDGNQNDADMCTNACTKPVCGDKIVQMGEACDDGGETATCNANCTKPACGDSIVNMSAGEECDDGNNVNTDECVAMCKKASCGDTFVQAGVEECDEGAETKTCSDQCTIKGLRVFVTSTTYNGNLGGLAGADAKCQERAAAAGLAGTYMAWLSDATNGPSQRFMTKTGPYVLLTGAVLAESWADLTDGSLLTPLTINELGLVPANQNFVWTNTKIDGSPATGDVLCKGWMDASGGPNRGTRGNRSNAGAKWTQDGDDKCDFQYRLYCFQQ